MRARRGRTPTTHEANQPPPTGWFVSLAISGIGVRGRSAVLYRSFTRTPQPLELAQTPHFLGSESRLYEAINFPFLSFRTADTSTAQTSEGFLTSIGRK